MEVAFKEREGSTQTWRAGADRLQEWVREPHPPAGPGEGGVGFWEDLGPHLGQSQRGEVTVMGPGLSFLPLEAKGQATQVRDNEAQVSFSKENACMGGSSA